MSPELSDVSGAALLGIESAQTKPRAMTQPSWRDRRRQGAISVYTESFVAVKEVAIDIDCEFESERAHRDLLLYTVGGLIMYHFETTTQCMVTVETYLVPYCMLYDQDTWQY